MKVIPIWNKPIYIVLGLINNLRVNFLIITTFQTYLRAPIRPFEKLV
jgi:hypothetical protein